MPPTVNALVAMMQAAPAASEGVCVDRDLICVVPQLQGRCAAPGWQVRSAEQDQQPRPQETGVTRVV
jgi:hypothetical protein